MEDLDWMETPNTKIVTLKSSPSFCLILTIYIC